MPPWRRFTGPTMVGRQKTPMTRALLVAAACCLTLPARPSFQEPDPVAARARGRKEAPVTIYEMSDFQCPYCREFALGTLPLLEREFLATGKVRLVYINLPLWNVHKNALAAAEVAMCAARQQRFWPMHDLLFRHQDEWAPLASPRAYLLGLGDSVGLERATFVRCVTSGASSAEVQADAERAHRSGATSTPTFYIEGALLEGAAPVAVFRTVLDSIYQSKTAR